MPYVQVNYDTYTDVVEEGDNEQWGRRDCTQSQHDIIGVSQVGDEDYHDLTVEFELHPLETYYLVYVTFTTGDSFGYDGGRIEFIGLYQNENVAWDNVRRIKEHNNEYKERNRSQYVPSSKKKEAKKKGKFEEFSVDLVTENGKKYQLYTPWHGYFERLEDVVCEPVLVGE